MFSSEFSPELAPTLVAMLAKIPEAGTLKRVVAESAVAADALCGNRPMACGPGCPHCCVLNVAVLLPEGMVIADWLRQQHPAKTLDALREQLAAHSRRVRWMEDEERIFEHAACPLLDPAGNCSVHPVRPLECRGAASLDRDSCRTAFRPFFIDQEPRVPADLLRQAAFDSAFKALARALQHHGLDDRSIELGRGVLAFLDRPECRDLLLSGERLPQELWD